METKHQVHSLGSIMRFFIFCSAADQRLLMQCPSAERHKYASIGATVFFTGSLAALSGGYALYTVFNSVWAAVLLGIFWGVLIFNLDRFIVSTIKKGEWKYNQILQVIPRTLLAIFLAVVISKPLELKIFQQEINESLHYTGAKKLEDINVLYDKKIEVQNSRIGSLREKTEERYATREKYFIKYKCECEGSCGTGEKGIGPLCLINKEKYLDADKDYQELKLKNQKLIDQIEQEITALKLEKETYKETLSSTFSNGLLAQLEALNTLPPGPSIAIVLLLIFIEISPIFAKLLSPYGPYDHLLKTVEYDYEIEEISSINLRNQKLNNQLTLLASVEQQKVEQQVSNNKETMHLIEKAHQELIKEQLAIWVEDEKEKLREKAIRDKMLE
ncbi:MAG: DUF4407 domain-containing protein [Fulvivirga sp.]